MTALQSALATQRDFLQQEVGVSPWITVTQTMIDEFAGTTMDPQFIHTDPARAVAETPFGGTIAHGYLTLSFASKFAIDALDPVPGVLMTFNYGFDRIRFLAPVRSGQRIRGRFTLLDVAQKSAENLLMKYDLVIDLEGSNTPAIAAEWLIMHSFAAENIDTKKEKP